MFFYLWMRLVGFVKLWFIANIAAHFSKKMGFRGVAQPG
jgi:hypothetical protein